MRLLWRALVAAVLGLYLLTACARPESGMAPAVVTVRVVPGPILAEDEIISAFQDRYPQYRVEKVSLEPFGMEMWTADTMATLIREKKADVVIASPELVQDRLLLGLDPFLSKTQLPSDGYQGLLDALRRDGRLYELPVSVGAQVLAYNPSLFQERGVDFPSEGWTWEEFRTKAKALTFGQGPDKVWGFYWLVPADLVMRMLEQRGVESPDKADPAVLKDVLQFVETMVKTDQSLVPAKDIDYGEPTFLLNDEPNYFKQRRAAMSLAFRTHPLARDKYNKAQWEVTPLPTWPGQQPVLPISVTAYAIAANTEVPDASWAFLQFLSGEPGAVHMAWQGDIPAYVSEAVQKAWFEQAPPPPKSTAHFFAIPRRLRSDGDELFYRQVNSMLANQQASEEMLQSYLEKRKKQ